MSAKKTLCVGAVTAAALLAGLEPAGAAVTAGAGAGPAEQGTAAAGSRYHVDSYDARLAYDPNLEDEEKELSGEATLDLVVTKPGKALDLRMQLPATSVTVDGKPAETTADKGTLRVKPEKSLSQGQRLKVHVTYQGSPRRTLDDPTMDNPAWAPTKDGGHYLVLGSAGLLFPANTDRSDRSAVHVQATVPEELTAVSNGPATAPRKEDGHKIYQWDNPDPMPAEYVHFGVGSKWTESDGTLPDGTPVHFLYGDNAKGEDGKDSVEERGRKLAEALPEAAQWQAGLFGKYRHESLTISFLDFEDLDTPNVAGWNTIVMSMETRAGEGEPPVAATQDILVHELAHTWLEAIHSKDGDAYVEEAIPTYLQWAWLEKFSHEDLVAKYRDAIKDIDARGWDKVSAYNVSGPGMHGLRRLVGDAPFEQALKDWLPAYAGKSATWDDFRTIMKKHSNNKNLKAFFDAWFPPQGTTRTKPSDDILWPDWTKN